MTKKDYELLARVLNRHLPVSKTSLTYSLYLAFVGDLNRELKKDNPNFNDTMFINAMFKGR